MCTRVHRGENGKTRTVTEPNFDQDKQRQRRVKPPTIDSSWKAKLMGKTVYTWYTYDTYIL